MTKKETNTLVEENDLTPEEECVLGLAYLEGYYVRHNIKKAISHLEKAAEENSALAKFRLSKIYLTENESYTDLKRGFELLKESAKKYVDCYYDLAYCYYVGKGTEVDYKSAVSYLKKTDLDKDDYAQEMMGECYYYGRGVPVDMKLAKDYFQKAAKAGNDEAKDYLKKMN